MQWGLSESSRQTKYYRLTRTGRETVKREVATWTRYTGAVRRVLEPAREII
ncbi:MAG TPA: hypothetical protein VMM18_05370 [Gemmatimonadaceae bacterium]|nr:hypothetical protein [Gemmatimonadaceae bacterium]